jgi:hypothetical protein
VQQVAEAEHDVVAGIIDRVLGRNQVLRLPVLLPVLDELRELPLYRTTQVVHLALLLSLDQHGAKL